MTTIETLKEMLVERCGLQNRGDLEIYSKQDRERDALTDAIRQLEAINEIRVFCGEYICGENESEDEGIKGMQDFILGLLPSPPEREDAK